MVYYLVTEIALVRVLFLIHSSYKPTMARTALTAAVNVVRVALMEENVPKRFTNQLKRAKKGGWEHKATILLTHLGDSTVLRARARSLLESQFVQ